MVAQASAGVWYAFSFALEFQSA